VLFDNEKENIMIKQHESKLIKSVLEITKDKPRAVYLTDGTKINIEYGKNRGAWLKIGPTPEYNTDNDSS